MLNKVLIAISICGWLLTENALAKPKVLVFTKTTRYKHESIPDATKALIKLGKQNDFEVDTTTDAKMFNPKTLTQYKSIIFLSTTGDLLDSAQKACFIKYIHNGGGFVGIHSASASEKGWPWYGRLVGAVFTDHPEPQTGNVLVINRTDPSTRHLPRIWVRKDEWYNFDRVPTDVSVLICADERSYEGGKNGKYHPLAWKHSFEGGKVFYTALGHFSESYSDPLFLKHLLGGIKYTMAKK
ncbi:MAG: ThuA domain-containing protein [Pedobacter sp.]|nr:MAG: ThuA domain-containing protein [Pedobacter sp.]